MIEEDWERISLRERAEIAAEIEQLMNEEWWQWCEENEKLPAIVKTKKEKNEKSRIFTKD